MGIMQVVHNWLSPGYVKPHWESSGDRQDSAVNARKRKKRKTKSREQKKSRKNNR